MIERVIDVGNSLIRRSGALDEIWGGIVGVCCRVAEVIGDGGELIEKGVGVERGLPVIGGAYGSGRWTRTGCRGRCLAVGLDEVAVRIVARMDGKRGRYAKSRAEGQGKSSEDH